MARLYNNCTAPVMEQKICVTCGFCCDATLFLKASLSHGERGHLPEKIEEASFTEEGKDFFLQPCLYFSGECTIYNRQRANICSTYRCRLLREMEEGKIAREDALKTVREAMDLRNAIMGEYKRISGKSAYIGFRQLLTELGKQMKHPANSEVPGGDYEMLLIRCNILEALLIKVFLPAEEYEKYVMK